MPADLKLIGPNSGGVAAYPPGASYGPRQMQEWEFVWMLQGDAEYRWGGRTAAAPQGSFVLCRPGETDFFQWDRHRRTRHAYFHFQMTDLPEGWRDWPLVCEAAEDDLLRPLFRHVLTWINRSRLEDEQNQQAIGLMLSVFCSSRRATGSVPREVWPPAVERVCAYLFQRLEEDPAASLTLSDLASVGCVTPEHLCRLFHVSVGHSPVQTVRLARLERAAVLLARSNYSIGEIAALHGYLSPFHFSRALKTAFGLSPMLLRRRAQSGGGLPPTRLRQTYGNSSLGDE